MSIFSYIILYSLDFSFIFFFNDTSTTDIYTLSLHDALPISRLLTLLVILTMPLFLARLTLIPIKSLGICFRVIRSEERFSRNAETDLVCRLLLEKKKQT